MQYYSKSKNTKILLRGLYPQRPTEAIKDMINLTNKETYFQI